MNDYYDYDAIKGRLVKYTEKLGRIPTYEEIKKIDDIPSAKYLTKAFRENGFHTYFEYLLSLGYKKKPKKFVNKRENKYSHLNYESICELWEKYYEENGLYPNSLVCNQDPDLPSWDTVSRRLGERFYKFCEQFNLNKNKRNLSYEQYCDLYKEACIKENRNITCHELSSYKLPSARWFIKNTPSNTVTDFHEFIAYIGLVPFRNISKEVATKAIHQMHSCLGRNLMYDDFRNPQFNQIGVKTILNHWGTFNNMMKELGFEINQENMFSKHRDIEELKMDIISLCNKIKEQEGRIIICSTDIKESNDCLSVGTYQRYFKEELDMTLGEFIKSIGFTPVNIGTGMTYEFPNGEITKSKFEYETSMYFTKNNIQYDRDIKYKTFDELYVGNKDCDYVIHHNDQTWYVEIAGVLYNSTNAESDDFIKAKYRKGLSEKEEILKRNSLNYKIIYPVDFYKDSLDEIFSFLHN